MITDKVGTPIVVGSIIAYGHALGRCAGIRIGKVLAIKDNGNITVRGVEDDWPTDYRPFALCRKNGTLQFPDRIVVLDRGRVDQRYLELLDTVQS